MKDFRPDIEKHEERPTRRDFLRHLGATATYLFTTSAVGIKAKETTQTQSSSEQQRSDSQEFKKLVDKEDVLGKIAKLKEIFGPALNYFLEVRRIETDLGMLDKGDPSSSDAYRERWVKVNIERKPTALKNINRVGLFNTKILQEFLDKNYPPNYLINSVGEIEFVPDQKAKDNLVPMGMVTPYVIKLKGEDDRVLIKIDMPRVLASSTRGREAFLETLKHEIGHATNWENNGSLTSAERVSMLSEVAERATAKDRHKSPYVEGINDSYIDKLVLGKVTDKALRQKYLAYIRANEYWAEIAMAYFQNPERFKKNNPKDYELVKKWVDRSTI